MPKQRFWNLPQEKQERIAQAAIAEYAEKGPDGASVAGLIEKAEIPRGSFYQYFEDLDDLSEYVFGLIAKAKMEYLADVLQLPGKVPFLEFFRRVYASALEFARANPDLLAIGSHLYNAQGVLSLSFVQRAKAEGKLFYRKLIEQEKAEGRLRSEVDSDVLASLMISMSSDVALRNMYEEHKSNEEIMVTVNSLIDIIENGIVPNKRG